jgi:hypothetical protein
MRTAIALACGVTVLGAACGGDDATSGIERHASAWEQVIRVVGLADVPPVAEDDPLPVVFAYEVGGDDVPAEVQVEVVNALLDEADVRFVDDPDVVVDVEDGDDAAVVDDDGVLVVMETPPESGTEASVEVVRYRTLGEETTFDVVLSGGGSDWAVRTVTPID